MILHFQIGRACQILHRSVHGVDVRPAVLHTDSDHLAIDSGAFRPIPQSIICRDDVPNGHGVPDV